MKMIKTKAKRDIETILKNSITPGTYLYIKSQSIPAIPVFQVILGILTENNSKILLPFDRFDALFSAFKKQAKKDLNMAMISFLKGLEEPQKKSNALNKLKRDASIKGKKNVKKEEWEFYREALDILNDKPSTALLIFHSYWTMQAGDIPNPTSYIRAVYGISPDEYKKPIIQQYVHNIRRMVIANLNFLKALSDLTFEMFENHSEFKKWFVDMFGENARYYLNDWGKYKRNSRNKPDFDRSYKLFIEFLGGKTYKAGSHFAERYRPQGIIRLLYKIHCVLYWFKDYEDEMIQKMSIKVKELFKGIPPYFYRRIIKELYTEEFPILLSITNKQSHPKTFKEACLNAAKAHAVIFSPSTKKAIDEFIERELRVFSTLLPKI